MLHTWSLSVEEQFYFVFPALVVGAWRLSTRAGVGARRSIAVIVGAFTVGSFVWSTYVTLAPDVARGWAYGFYSPWSRAWEFGVGALLAAWAPRVGRRTSDVLGGVGLVLVGAAAVTFSGGTPFPGPAALMPVVGTALLILGAGRLSEMLSARPLVRLGDLSYGWYLWHWPLIVFAVAMWPGNRAAPVLAAVLSLGTAWLSWRIIENPIRFDTRLVGYRVLLLGASCVIVPISVLGFVVGNTAEGQGIAAPPVMEGRSGRIVLVGDSNAGHFAAPVGRAAAALDFSMDLRTGTGCAFADVRRETALEHGFDGEACYQAVSATVTELVESPPALVIVAMAGPQYLTADALALTDPVTGERATGPERKAVVWATGLGRTLNRLDAAAVPVLYVHAVPHLADTAEEWTSRTCPAIRPDCGITVARDEVEDRRRRALTAEMAVLDGLPSVASVDFTDTICSATECPSTLYRDATHLSSQGALTLTEQFADLIERRHVP